MSSYLTLTIKALVNVLLPYLGHQGSCQCPPTLPWPLGLLSMSSYLTLTIKALVNVLLPYLGHQGSFQYPPTLSWPLRLLSISSYLTLAIKALVNVLLSYLGHQGYCQLCQCPTFFYRNIYPRLVNTLIDFLPIEITLCQNTNKILLTINRPVCEVVY